MQFTIKFYESTVIVAKMRNRTTTANVERYDSVSVLPPIHRRKSGVDDVPFHGNATYGREAYLPGLRLNADGIDRVALDPRLGVDAACRRSAAT